MKPPSLTVTSSGPLLGATLVIERDEMVVGRREDCDLVLADDFVSRRHAMLRRSPVGVSVEDLGSTGRTFVNGRPVDARTPLHDGDTVRFGQVDAVFRAQIDDDLVLQPVPGAPGTAAPALRSMLVDGVIVCLTCGTKNQPGAVFCVNPDCGAFLEFSGEQAGRKAPPPPPEPEVPVSGAEPGEPPGVAERRSPREDVRVGVAASLSTDSLSVEPAGETSCEVKVRNTGTLVDGVTVAVLGDASAWATVEPDRLSLMPGSEATATIRFRPPRDPSARAGEAPFEVRATSGEDAGVTAAGYGILTVGSFHEMSMELVPGTSRGRRVGAHRLTVHNGGNAPLPVDIVADDPDQLLQFATSPSHLDLEPGSSAVSRIQVRAVRRLWWGPARSLPLRVSARPPAGEPARAAGAFGQEPIFPKWFRKVLLWPVGLTAAAAVALLLIAHPWKKPPTPVVVPDCASQPEAQCTALLSDAGLKVNRQTARNGTVLPGFVIATNPPAGTMVKAGKSIVVTVSEGLVVPADVIGKLEADARNELELLGFVVPKPASTQEGGQKGQVAKTVPDVGTVLKAGDQVQLIVSSGATSTTTSTTTKPTTTTAPTTTSTSTSTTTTTKPSTTTSKL